METWEYASLVSVFADVWQTARAKNQNRERLVNRANPAAKPHIYPGSQRCKTPVGIMQHAWQRLTALRKSNGPPGPITKMDSIPAVGWREEWSFYESTWLLTVMMMIKTCACLADLIIHGSSSGAPDCSLGLQFPLFSWLCVGRHDGYNAVPPLKTSSPALTARTPCCFCTLDNISSSHMR